MEEQIKTLNLENESNTYKIEEIDNVSDSFKEENKEFIINDFIDIKETKDYISTKGHIINPTLNVYSNLDGSLNSETNPFIIENNNFEKIKNKMDIDMYNLNLKNQLIKNPIINLIKINFSVFN